MGLNSKRSKRQNNAIWALKVKARLSEDDFRALVFEARQSVDESTKNLTFHQANNLIKRLGGTPIPEAKIYVVKGRAKSKRTEQYHHQQFGINRIHTEPHLQKWVAAGKAVGFDETALQNFTRNMIRERIPSTTKKTNIVIEALKKMHGRGWRADKAKTSEFPDMEGAA